MQVIVMLVALLTLMSIAFGFVLGFVLGRMNRQNGYRNPFKKTVKQRLLAWLSRVNKAAKTRFASVTGQKGTVSTGPLFVNSKVKTWKQLLGLSPTPKDWCAPTHFGVRPLGSPFGSNLGNLSRARLEEERKAYELLSNDEDDYDDYDDYYDDDEVSQPQPKFTAKPNPFLNRESRHNALFFGQSNK